MHEKTILTVRLSFDNCEKNTKGFLMPDNLLNIKHLLKWIYLIILIVILIKWDFILISLLIMEYKSGLTCCDLCKSHVPLNRMC